MKNTIKVINNYRVRQFCIRNKFYTKGTDDEFVYLLESLCASGKELTYKDMVTIATDIINHSNLDYFKMFYGYDNNDDMLIEIINLLSSSCCITYLKK